MTLIHIAVKIVKNDGTKIGIKLKNGTLTAPVGNLQKRKVDVAFYKKK